MHSQTAGGNRKRKKGLRYRGEAAYTKGGICKHITGVKICKEIPVRDTYNRYI